MNNVFVALAFVVSVTSAFLLGSNPKDMTVTGIDDGEVQVSTRLRRAVGRGAFTHRSSQQSSFVRRKFHQKLATSPEGGVSLVTKHRHEKGSMARATNKAGYFTYDTYPY